MMIMVLVQWPGKRVRTCKTASVSIAAMAHDMARKTMDEQLIKCNVFASVRCVPWLGTDSKQLLRILNRFFFCSASASVYCAVRGDFSFVLNFFLIKVIVSNWREQTESFALSLSHVGAAASQPKLFILLMESTGESHQKNLRRVLDNPRWASPFFMCFFLLFVSVLCWHTTYTEWQGKKLLAIRLGLVVFIELLVWC